jgi:hypothetical protein
LTLDSSGNLLVGGTSTTAKLAVANNTNDGTFSIRQYAVFGTSTTYLDSDAENFWGGGLGEFQIQNGTSTRPAMLSLGGSLGTAEGLGVINFFRSGNTDGYRSRAQIASSVTNTGTANQHGGDLRFYTAADNATNPTERARIDSSGNFGIGTSSPGQKVEIATSSGAAYTKTTNGTVSVFAGVESSNFGLFGTTSNHSVKFITNDAERARIDTGGALLVGRTSRVGGNAAASYIQTLATSGSTAGYNVQLTNTSTASVFECYNSGSNYIGGITCSNTATSFPTSSDIRLKKDVADAGSASAKVQQIRIVSHGWKSDDSTVEFGVIAQELASVAPQAVMVGDDGDEIKTTWGVDYSKLVPMLIKAIQELKADLDATKAELAALKGQA